MSETIRPRKRKMRAVMFRDLARRDDQRARHSRRQHQDELARAESYLERYRCCGMTFDASLGKYGCPNCLGDKPATLEREHRACQ
jgi:hypothetical protein